MRSFADLQGLTRMPRSKLTLSFVAFALIWSGWSIWSSLEPAFTSEQLVILFFFVPLSALLLAISFFDDEDDDDFGGGILQPIMQRR